MEDEESMSQNSDDELQFVDFPSSKVDKIFGDEPHLSQLKPETQLNNYLAISNTIEEESEVSQTNQILGRKYLNQLYTKRDSAFFKNCETTPNPNMQLKGAVQNINYERKYKSEMNDKRLRYSLYFAFFKLFLDLSLIASYFLDSTSKSVKLIYFDAIIVSLMLPVYLIAQVKWKYVPSQPLKVLIMDLFTCLVVVLNVLFKLSLYHRSLEIILVVKLWRIYDVTFICNRILYHTAFHYSSVYSLLESGLYRYLIKTLIVFTNLTFLVSAVFQFISRVDHSFFNSTLTYSEAFYFTISTFTLLGSSIKPSVTHAKMLFLVFFLAFIFYVSKVLVRTISIGRNNTFPKKITEFSNHNVILGKLKESTLIKIIEELYSDFDLISGVKPPTTIIIVNNSNFNALKAHKFHLNLFFTFEILALSNENLDLLNLENAACVYFLNHNKFEDQSRLVNTVLFQCFKLASPSTNFFIQTNNHCTLRNFVSNYFFINTSELRYNLIARSAFNKGYLNFIYNLVIREEVEYSQTGNEEIDQYLSGRTNRLIVREIPKTLEQCPYNRLVWNIYEESKSDSPVMLIGRISINHKGDIENVLYTLDKQTVSPQDRGIFLAREEEEVEGVLRTLTQDSAYRVKSALFQEVISETVDEFRKTKIQKIRQSIQSKKVYSFSRPENRFIRGKDYGRVLSEHIVIFGFESTIEKLILKLRLHDLTSTIVIVEEDTKPFETKIKELLVKFTNLVVFESDFNNITYLEDSVKLGSARVAVILKKEDCFKNLVLFRLVEKYFKIPTSVELESKELYRFISCRLESKQTKQIPFEILNSSFLKGEILFSSLIEVFPALSSKNPKEMFCLAHLMSNDFSEMKTYSAAGESYMFKDVNIYSNATSVLSFDVPVEFIGKRYENVVDSFMRYEKLFVVLGIFVGEQAKVDSIPDFSSVNSYSNGTFITNPSKNYVVKANSEVLVIGNFEKNKEKLKEMETVCYVDYAKKLASVDLTVKKRSRTVRKALEITTEMRNRMFNLL